MHYANTLRKYTAQIHSANTPYANAPYANTLRRFISPLSITPQQGNPRFPPGRAEALAEVSLNARAVSADLTASGHNATPSIQQVPSPGAN
eukprot:4744137-Pyramimonas_sp.AAC.1